MAYTVPAHSVPSMLASQQASGMDVSSNANSTYGVTSFGPAGALLQNAYAGASFQNTGPKALPNAPLSVTIRNSLLTGRIEEQIHPKEIVCTFSPGFGGFNATPTLAGDFGDDAIEYAAPQAYRSISGINHVLATQRARFQEITDLSGINPFGVIVSSDKPMPAKTSVARYDQLCSMERSGNVQLLHYWNRLDPVRGDAVGFDLQWYDDVSKFCEEDPKSVKLYDITAPLPKYTFGLSLKEKIALSKRGVRAPISSSAASPAVAAVSAEPESYPAMAANRPGKRAKTTLTSEEATEYIRKVGPKALGAFVPKAAYELIELKDQKAQKLHESTPGCWQFVPIIERLAGPKRKQEFTTKPSKRYIIGTFDNDNTMPATHSIGASEIEGSHATDFVQPWANTNWLGLFNKFGTATVNWTFNAV